MVLRIRVVRVVRVMRVVRVVRVDMVSSQQPSALARLATDPPRASV